MATWQGRKGLCPTVGHTGHHRHQTFTALALCAALAGAGPLQECSEEGQERNTRISPTTGLICAPLLAAGGQSFVDPCHVRWPSCGLGSPPAVGVSPTSTPICGHSVPPPPFHCALRQRSVCLSSVAVTRQSRCWVNSVWERGEGGSGRRMGFGPHPFHSVPFHSVPFH